MMKKVRDNVIKEKGDFILTRPYNSWDMNYHLINTKEGLDYLIDLNDIWEKEEVEDEDISLGLYWEDFKELVDIDEIINYAWKVLEL